MSKILERKANQAQAIKRHGENLMSVFPMATERDPIKLCEKLRRLEFKAYQVSLRACNGRNYDDSEEQDQKIADVLDNVDRVLKFKSSCVPVFVNLDARGYALKIRDDWMQANPNKLEKDWGGYGLIAPEIEG